MLKKIYYINLEDRPYRKKHIENQIKKINFLGKVECINAAYGKNLDLSLIPSNLFTEEAIKSTTNKNDINNTTTMTKGGMGVAISHKWICEKILCGEEEYALILEDDATICDNFIEKMDILLKKINYFDMLWIGYHNKYDLKIGYVDIPSVIWGMFGYIINKKAAKNIIDMFPITNQIDSEIIKIFPNLVVYAVKKEDVLITSPTSEDKSEFSSDIQFNREEFNNNNNNIITFLLICIIIIIIIIIMYKH